MIEKKTLVKYYTDSIENKDGTFSKYRINFIVGVDEEYKIRSLEIFHEEIVTSDGKEIFKRKNLEDNFKLLDDIEQVKEILNEYIINDVVVLVDLNYDIYLGDFNISIGRTQNGINTLTSAATYKEVNMKELLKILVHNIKEEDYD